MKKLVLVLTLAAIALAGTAIAQDPSYRNNIGVYADEGGTQITHTLGYYEILPLYLVMTKSTTSEIQGWEAKILFDNMTLLDLTPRGDYVDAATRAHEYIVGLGVPLPVVGGVCVLADIQVMLLPASHDRFEKSFVYIEGVYFYALPGEYREPAYQDAEGVIRQAYQSTGYGLPVFILNCGPVAVEQDTWGGVKSLYR